MSLAAEVEVTPRLAQPDAADTLVVRLPSTGVETATRWTRKYARLLLLVDAVVIAIAATTALIVRFGASNPTVPGLSAHLPYVAVSLALVVMWVVVLAMSRAYETRFLGTGSEEFKRVFNASVRLMALVGLIGFAAHVEFARGYVAIAFPMGTALLVGSRHGVRKIVHRRRARGHWLHRAVAVGTPERIAELARQVERDPSAGFSVVGACLPTESLVVSSVGDETVPVVGTTANVLAAVRSVGADTVAVTESPATTSDDLRRLAWSLEGTGVQLVVAPSLTNVSGPRISIRPVAGLPLLHVEHPEFEGARRVLKGVIDRLGALALVLVISPVLIAIATAIKLTSPGPAVFRQIRVGKNGRLFTVYKFRSMVVDAEHLLSEIRAYDDGNGMLFKCREDPRVTLVGRFIRKHSLDELPQLFNVLKGDMALVGPRPPLPSEVEQYGADVRRRLLVKPGITGLWQINGRSDLSWEDSVRHDLFYVENWSLALDLLIIWKTVFAVLHGRGAY